MDAKELCRAIARLRDESATRQQAMREMRAEMDRMAAVLARLRAEQIAPAPWATDPPACAATGRWHHRPQRSPPPSANARRDAGNI
jgi:hypothetical protein